MDTIREEIKKHCKKSFEEIQSAFENNLVVLKLRVGGSFDDEEQLRKYTNTQFLLRQRMERYSVAKIDGECFMLIDDYKSESVGIIERDFKTLYRETIAELKDYYLKEFGSTLEDRFSIELLVKPYPTIKPDQYQTLHSVNKRIGSKDVIKELKAGVDDTTLQVYKQMKTDLMYVEDIQTKGGIVKHSEFLDTFEDIFNVPERLPKAIKAADPLKVDRIKLYELDDTPAEVIKEVEKKRALWYYKKVKYKSAQTQPVKKMLKPRLIDGFNMFSKRAEFFYEATEDKEFEPQFEMIRETREIVDEYIHQLEKKKQKK